MAVEKKVVVDLSGGWVDTLPSEKLSPNVFEDISNLSFSEAETGYAGNLKIKPASTPICSFTDSPIKSLHQFQGLYFVEVGTHLYKTYDFDTFTPIEPWALDLNVRLRSAIYLNKIYFVNGEAFYWYDENLNWGGIYKWPVGYYIVAHKGLLFVGNVNGVSNRIRWNALHYEGIPVYPDDLRAWEGGGWLDLAIPNAITGLASYQNEELIIFQRHNTWILYGDNPNNFVIKELKTNDGKSVGCVSNETVRLFNSRLVWLAEDGLYQFDGSNVMEVSRHRVEKTLKYLVKKPSYEIYQCGTEEEWWNAGRYGVDAGGNESKNISGMTGTYSDFGELITTSQCEVTLASGAVVVNAPSAAEAIGDGDKDTSYINLPQYLARIDIRWRGGHITKIKDLYVGYRNQTLFINYDMVAIYYIDENDVLHNFSTIRPTDRGVYHSHYADIGSVVKAKGIRIEKIFTTAGNFHITEVWFDSGVAYSPPIPLQVGSQSVYRLGLFQAKDKKGEKRYEYNTEDINTSRNAYGNNWLAQTFQVGYRGTDVNEFHSPKVVKLRLQRTGNPGTVEVSIYSIDGGLPQTPIPDYVATTNGDTLPVAPNWEWREFVFDSPGEELEKNQVYAIVLKAPSGNASNYVSWAIDSDSPSYAAGNVFTYNGMSWTPIVTEDAVFEVWTRQYITYSYRGANTIGDLEIASWNTITDGTDLESLFPVKPKFLQLKAEFNRYRFIDSVDRASPFCDYMRISWWTEDPDLWPHAVVYEKQYHLFCMQSLISLPFKPPPAWTILWDGNAFWKYDETRVRVSEVLDYTYNNIGGKYLIAPDTTRSNLCLTYFNALDRVSAGYLVIPLHLGTLVNDKVLNRYKIGLRYQGVCQVYLKQRYDSDDWVLLKMITKDDNDYRVYDQWFPANLGFTRAGKLKLELSPALVGGNIELSFLEFSGKILPER